MQKKLYFDIDQTQTHQNSLNFDLTLDGVKSVLETSKYHFWDLHINQNQVDIKAFKSVVNA